MITKVTTENSVALQKRLAEISQALGKPINNIEQYYQNIEEIAALQTTNGSSYKYFLMPLDEPVFEIDANTRKINVPQHFSKNGVGVRGDHMAEILYFKVDRYFDYKDLYSCDDIIINWQFRPANASRNAELETYTSYALAPDETYDPGHIVFGWVIGNYVESEDEEGNRVIAHMTPSRGTLTFSVSFLKRESDGFSYMLSTQTASVNIYDSLIIEDPSKLDPTNKPLFKGLQNSAYTPESLNPLIAPIFLSGKEANDGANIKIYSGLDDFANFEFNDLENPTAEKDTLVLTARAGVVDMADGLEYKWTGVDYDGAPLGDGPDGSIINNVAMIPIVDGIEFDETKFYYKKVVGGYERLDTEEVFQDALNNNEIIYELGNSINVTKGGSYMVSVSSWKEAVDENNVALGTATSPAVDSNVCFVPKAAVPAVKLFVEDDNKETLFDTEDGSLKDGLFIDENRDDQVNVDGKATFLDYKYYDQEDPASMPPAFKAEISIDSSKIEKREYENGQEILSGREGVTKNSSLGFVKLYLTDTETAPQDYESDSVAKDYIPGGTSAILDVPEKATRPGEWKVFAVNERNRTFSLSDASNPVYVSKVAPKAKMTLNAGLVKNNGREDELVTILEDNVIKEAYDATQEKRFDITTNASSLNLHIKVKFDENSEDTITDMNKVAVEIVEMKAVADEEGNTTFEPMGANEDRDEPNIYKADYNSTAQEFIVSQLFEGGIFKLKATTTYHGTKRVTISDPFMISMT